MANLKAFLEGLYYVYNRRELVSPDPLMFLYDYADPLDREIVGLLASCLAYGRVAQILASLRKVLTPLGESPRRFLLEEHQRLRGLYSSAGFRFKHRFTTGEQLESLLQNVHEVLLRHGSLQLFLGDCLQGGALLQGLDRFSMTLEPHKRGFPLLTAPQDQSACKRLLLYLKWMVRSDEVDPGGWGVLSPKDLLMPTDTHIYNISLQLGLTRRRSADLKTVLEITRAFAELTPEDPTRYDFALSRFGIRTGLTVKEMLASLD